MLKLSFSTNKYHLAYSYWLQSAEKNNLVSGEWEQLKVGLAKSFGDHPGFQFFQRCHIGYSLDLTNPKNDNLSVEIRDKKLIREIFQTIFEALFFKRVYQETESYRIKLEKEWVHNLTTSLKYVQEITGMGFDTNVDVIMLHPDLDTGSYIGNKKVEFGLQIIYKNFQTVGLYHEILH